MLQHLRLFFYKETLIFVSFLLASNAYSQVFSCQNFDHSSGLQNETILSLAEDNNGFIWFGTDGAGLIRYDGENFEYFQHYDSRNQHHINGIAVSDKNEIYFSSKYKQFLKHENKGTTPIYKPSPNRFSKEGIYIIGNTKILFTSNSITLLDSKGNVKQHQIISDKKSLSIYQYLDLDDAVICFTTEGNFWINENVILRLSDWLGVSEATVKDFKHGTINNGTLLLLDKKLTKMASIKLHSSNPGFLDIAPINTKKQLLENETITYGCSRNENAYFVTNIGHLYSFKNNTIKKVQLSQSIVINNPTQLLIDFNENIWISTTNKGVYKLSKNAFTPIANNTFYANTYIAFVNRPDDSTIIISTDNNETLIGSIYKDDTLAYYKTKIVTSVRIDNHNFYSSKNGVFKLTADKKLQPAFPYFQGKSCAVFYGSEEYIWINTKNDGLFKVYLNGRKERQNKDLPNYFYTTQIIDNKQYFGTNNGLYIYDLNKNTWSTELKGYEKKHSVTYIGVSTKDKYGNIYFSSNLGIIRISNKHEYSFISDEDFLSSKIFYTLNTDYRGNLLIGTNKGIILLTVNENGQPISGELYNSENGFDGYETNMRVQYQENFDSFLVGTIEGLYLVSPNLLYYHKKPRKPLVRYHNNGEVHLNQTDSLFQIQKGITKLKIDFGIVNNDENKTQYTYRIKGYTNKWSVLSKKRSVEYKNLPEGNYIFQVRATNNLEDYSATSEFNFMISTPFYKKQIFVFFIIILLVFINLLILNRTKKLSAENVIISKKSEMKKTVAFSILMFGGLANTAAHLIAPLIDNSLINNLTFSISLGLIVITIALILQFKESIFRSPKRIVFICFVLLTIFNFHGLIISKIHPYYVCSLLISLMLLPFIIHKSKNILLFGAVITTIGLIITFFLKDTFYDKTLFIISIGIASSVTVFSTFLRNNSYKKLLFTSSIINQGNVLVIAFKKDGTITFMSENFEALFDFKISKFIGKPISTLNQYQPELLLDTFRSINIKEEFEEDKIFTSPLTLQNSDVKYYQWSCKEFQNESRIILGQDITEKISLEKYYELLIHNSDDLIYQTDVDAKFVYLNEKCEEITGYSNNELLGSDIMQLIEPSHITRTLKFYGHQFNQRIKTTYYEFPIKTKKGDIKWLGQNVTTLFKDGSNHLINGYLASVKDITDKKNSVEVIADQNEQIKTSTTNAKHVQLNILPTKDKFDKNFHSSFVFSQPKDVVSGDFYWLEKVGDKKILVTADCNGHGVPGSIMTLLGINLINEIVLQEKISDPGKILTELHKKILKILPRESSEKINDKIKCSICLFSDKSKDIQFASANSKMALIREGKAITFQGNKENIGAKTAEDFIFKTVDVALNKDDSLYLFSDGFEQQLNVQTNQKVGENNFFKILVELEKQKNENAKDFISKTLEEHIGTGTQSDDVTIIKIKHLK